MDKNKYYLAVGLIGLLITTATVASISSANFEGPFDKEEMRQQIMEKREAIKEIIENNDYQAWADLMEEKAVALEERAQDIRDNITQENFEKLAEIHQLIQTGDRQGARELMGELGFGGFKGGMMRGHCK